MYDVLRPKQIVLTRKSLIALCLLLIGILSSITRSGAQPCLPPTGVSASPVSVCLGNPITLSATIPSGTTTINWYTVSSGGTAVATTTSASTTYTPTAAGTYTFYAEAASGSGGSGSPQIFLYSGAVQSATLAPGTYTLECWGANGGGSQGGKGGYSTGTFTLSSTTTIYVVVGGPGGTGGIPADINGGYNGGGPRPTPGGATRGSGGGATHIATATGLLSTLSANQSAVIIVAGGAGGGSNAGVGFGYGGGLTGQNSNGVNPGLGGTQSAGGAAGAGTGGSPGTFGQGGQSLDYAGAGGGGWYGGGAGGGSIGGNTSNGGGGGSGYIGGVTSGTSIQFGQTGFVSNPDATGNGYARITSSSSGCVSTRVATAIVTVNALPTVAVTPATANICSGSSIGLTASGATSYLWSPATGLSTNVGNAVTASPTATTTYTVTGTSNSCSATATRTVSVLPKPVATATATGPTTFCAGDSVMLRAPLFVTGNTYQWQLNNVNIAGATDTSYKVLNSGNYRLVISNSICGDTSSAIAVIVNPIPAVAVSPAATTICSGANVVLTASGSTGTYNWSPAGSLSATTGTTVTATPGTTTTYLLSSTVSGCTGTANAVVTVRNTPNTVISPATPIAICAGSNTVLTASGAATYSWSPAGSLSSDTAAVVTATPAATVTYTVVGTNVNGCSSTATQTVMVNNLPTVGVSPATATSICPGSNVVLTANGATSYSWTPAASLSSGTGATVTATPAATTTYTVTGTDNNGCTNTATKLVTVYTPNIVISPATAISFCGSGSATLTASGGVSYTWSPATNLNTTTGATVIATPTVTRTYTVTALDANGCTSTATKTITINTIPAVSITPATATTICEGSSVLLTGNGASTYSWSPSASLSASTGTTVIASPVTTTTYTVTVTSTAGCTATATKTVTVNAAPPVVVTPATTPVFCLGGSVAMTASGAVSYAWSPAATLSAATGATVTATPIITTTYTVTGTGANGCTKAVTQLLTVNPLPTLVVTPAVAEVCLGSGIVLNVTGASTYSWSPTATLSAGTGSSVTASPVVNTTYTINAIAANGCAGSTTKLVSVLAGPSVSVTPTSVTRCAGSPVVLTASGALSYSWSPGFNLSATTGASVTALPTSTTTYTVTGTSANGCNNTATATVNINPLPTVVIAPLGLNLSCQEIPVTLSASGAVTYSWSPATALSSTTNATVIATPTTTTVYTVIGTNSLGCSNITNVAVTRYPKPDATINPSGIVELCNGDTTRLWANYGLHPSYRWQLNGSDISGATSNNLFPANDGSYTIRVVDVNGCNGFTEVPANLTHVAIPLPVITANGSMLSTTIAFTTYQWYYNGQIITGATSRNYQAVRDGVYTVIVSNSTLAGCTGKAPNYRMTQLSITGTPLKKLIQIYPSPATDIIHISAPVSVTVLVSGMDGKLIWKQENAKDVDISQWADGVYNVVINEKDGTYIKNEKVMKINR